MDWLWDSDTSYLALWLLLLGVCSICIRKWSISVRLRNRVDILEIPVFLSITSLFLVFLFGFPVYQRPELLVFPSTSYLELGLLLGGVGLISMWIGYTAITSWLMRHAGYDNAEHSQGQGNFLSRLPPPSLWKTLVLYVVLLAVRITLFLNGSGEQIGSNRLGGAEFQQWLIFALELRWLVIALVTLQVFSNQWPRSVFFIVLSIEIPFALISGWSSSIPKILLLVWACLVYVDKQRRTLLGFAVAALAITVISVPVARELRAVIRFGEINAENVSTAMETVWSPGPNQNGIELLADLLVTRQSEIAQTPGLIMYLTPSVFPYLPIEELLVAPLTFIPRAIWPSKPIYPQKQTLLAVEYFGGAEGSGSAAVTMVGDAYLYGGWPVVVVGMLVLGVVTGAMYHWIAVLGFSNRNFSLLAVYSSVVIVNFHLGEGDLASVWQGLVQRSVVFLLAAVLIGVESPGEYDVSQFGHLLAYPHEVAEAGNPEHPKEAYE